MLTSNAVTDTLYPFGCSRIYITNWLCQGETMAPENIFAPAILKLRKELGETQEGMARRLNCSLPAYQRWEMGTRIPNGEYLLKMIQMCPNDACRAAFGLGPIVGPGLDPKSISKLQTIALRQHRILQESLSILEELRGSGSKVAGEKLQLMSKVLTRVVTALLVLRKEEKKDAEGKEKRGN